MPARTRTSAPRSSARAARSRHRAIQQGTRDRAGQPRLPLQSRRWRSTKAVAFPKPPPSSSGCSAIAEGPAQCAPAARRLLSRRAASRTSSICWRRGKQEFNDDRGFGYVLGSAFIETDRPEHASARNRPDLSQAARAREAPSHDGDGASARQRCAARARRTAQGGGPRSDSCRLVHALMGRALLRSGDQPSRDSRVPPRARDQPQRFPVEPRGRASSRNASSSSTRRSVYIDRALRMRPERRRRAVFAGWRLRFDRQDRTGPRDPGGDRQGRAEVFRGVRAARDRLLPLAAREDGDRMRAMVEQLNAEAQARQSSSRSASAKASTSSRLPTRSIATIRAASRTRTIRRGCPDRPSPS